MSREKLTDDKNNFDLSTLGDRLLYAIKLMHLNQKKFAEKATLLPATINGIIKSGKSPTAETLVQIHRAGISVLWLVMGEGEILVPEKIVEPQNTYPVQESESSPDASNLIKDGDKDRYQKTTLYHITNLLKNPDQIPTTKQKAINDLVRSILELLS